MKTLAAIVLLAAALSTGAQMYSNSITGELASALPNPLWLDGWKSPPSAEDYAAAGWAALTAEQIAALQQAAQAQAAQEYAAKVAAIAPEAAVFRLLYESHFGPGAVTNRAITEAAVAAYFTGRRVGKLLGTETNDISFDAQDIIALNRGFELIKAVTGDGTIWTFPWDLVPPIGP